MCFDEGHDLSTVGALVTHRRWMAVMLLTRKSCESLSATVKPVGVVDLEGDRHRLGV